MLLEHLRLPSR